MPKQTLNKTVAVILTIFTLQACTIAHYEIRNELPESKNTSHVKPCKINFFLSIDGKIRKKIAPDIEYDREELQELVAKYKSFTSNILNENGCQAEYVESQTESNFSINVLRSPLHSALPQEILTGLTFGAIPSWGTRENELTYKFKNKITEQEHTYYIDTKSYNHILLFPIFWVTFITLDEQKVFKQSLKNFLENS